MSQHAPDRLPYDLDTITQTVPPLSGVFALFSRGACLYVGASDDICASLLETYYGDSVGLREQELTHFTFEPVAPEARAARQAACLREFGPIGPRELRAAAAAPGRVAHPVGGR